MEIVEKAIETTATINSNRQLILDEPLPIADQQELESSFCYPMMLT